MAMMAEKNINSSSFMEMIANGYHTHIIDKIDPRSEDWLLVSSPFVPLGIVTAYLLFVKKLGPSFMANRSAYRIEPLIILYNVIQIVACLYIFIHGLTMWRQLGYNFTCQPVDYTVTEQNRAVANSVFGYYLIKISDLVDTVFFILRKKFSHASFLHVYHHAGMVIVGYLACKFSLNGHFVLLGIVNSFVHVCMYSYYLATAMWPETKPSLTVKKTLTIIQLVQFYVLLIHEALPLLQPNCDVQKHWAAALVVQYTFMIALFTDFYKKAYSGKKKTA
ncbi:elongation of very long chain fatty acids protein AAEL008004-like [Thrips palmi]|uniref:Elongation of very long chain fatty acids protein n=1 Tax=Thrips palmi TaxID=161013 RepID=A0A6P8ZNK1_THRPL|nr:elongation of very long chain fatty acids protein AAEL008004-like [Thrips palmi]